MRLILACAAVLPLLLAGPSLAIGHGRHVHPAVTSFVRADKAGCRHGNCHESAVGQGCLGPLKEGSSAGGAAAYCGRPAPMYPVPFATPRPTVPTQFTYPPMMPHNSLPHYRSTYSYRHAEGLSRTNVSWHKAYGVSGYKWLHHVFELPR